MFKINSFPNYGLDKVTRQLMEKGQQYVDQLQLHPAIKSKVFPNSFLDSPYYLIYPFLFNKAFEIRKGPFVEQLSLSGYLYFKYLLVVDALIDQDSTSTHENNTSNEVLLLRSHVYHDEAHKILARLFGGNQKFWSLWQTRNQEFMNMIAFDKVYNPDMSQQAYEQLAAGKCAFSKVVVDSFHCKKENKAMHQALTKAFDSFSVALCLQDDYEDFKKDLFHKKNNFSHVLLKRWLTEEKQQDFFNMPPYLLYKELHASGTAEQLMSLAMSYHDMALEAMAPYRDKLELFTKFIESYRNKCNLIKVNMRSYRVTQFVYQIDQKKEKRAFDLEEALVASKQYIEQRQTPEGAWHEVSNKQGLSDLWSTGFISMLLPESSQAVNRAGDYLLNHKSGDLWGYNVDWTGDYDSTTTALLTLHRCEKDITPHLESWFNGQSETGGFGTYSPKNDEIIQFLGFKNIKDIRGWTKSHICVSALAYYFLSQLEPTPAVSTHLDSLRDYLLSKRNKSGIWKPYWWTSDIYPTYFALSGMLSDGQAHDVRFQETMDSLMRQQAEDGSFACDMLQEKSVFYSSMVLDLLCQKPEIYDQYREGVNLTKSWILSNQHEDGSFTKSNFLAIPSTISPSRDAMGSYEYNIKGGTQTITGEVEGLFSSAMALKALTKYKSIAA